MKETAGANIDEAKGEMRVMLERRDIKNHLRDSGKLRGISGSSWDSQPTIPLSRSEVGSWAGSRRSFLLLEVSPVAIRDNLLLALDRLLIREISRPSASFGEPALIAVYSNEYTFA